MEFKLPDLGEDIEEAQVLNILVSSGDHVDAEQSVLEIETDKASFEVPAPTAGTIEEIKVAKGDTVKIGQVVAIIAEGGEEGSEADADRERGEDSDDDEGKDSKPDRKSEKRKKKKSGAKAKRDQGEKGPEDEEERSRQEEEDQQEKETPEDREQTDDDAGEAESPDEKEEADDEAEAVPEPSTGRVPVFAAPSVRQFARDIGVDVRRVPGTGPGGRISIEDVKRFARRHFAGKAGVEPGLASATAPLPDFSQWGEIEREDMGGVRRGTARHMVVSWQSVPHVTLFQKADATGLEEARQRFQKRSDKADATLSITAIMVKIAAAALRAHPTFTAAVDPAAKQIIRRRYAHIGVAVDTPRGLLVPVLRDVNEKNIMTIAAELEKMAETARKGGLKPTDMAGGVFTVTNLGGLGTGFFTPIVNHPESAILGVGRSAIEPVFDAGKQSFEPRHMLPLSLSFDHRLGDGADAARLLHWIAQAVEDPLLIALEG